MSDTLLFRDKTISQSIETQYKATVVRYNIFVWLWALATIFHMANNKMFADQLHFFLLTVAAIYLMIKPGSMFRFILFMCLQIFQVYKGLPMGSNHWLFAAFVNLTILQTLLYLVIKTKSFRIDRALLLETFAPIVRIELLILYFFVVFHKLNSDFFNTAVSCAANFYTAQNAYSLLPNTETILALNAYATVIIEALIPLLLIFRQTRNWGLLIGLVFHCIIAYNPLNGFYDFSSMIFAVYFLFTSYRFSNKVYSVYKIFSRKRTFVKNQLPEFSYFKLVVFIAAFALLIGCIHVLSNRMEDYFRHLLWTAFSFSFIGIFVLAMLKKETKTGRSDKAFQVSNGWFMVFPVLIFLNGICPYLGLKTENSFAMFSNLRTEGGITNHYLVPVETQIFDYQKDLVEIVSSSDKVLKEYEGSGKLIVYHQFVRMVDRRNPKSLVYIHNGKQHFFSIDQATPAHPLVQEPSYLEKKFLRFRDIHKEDPQPCAH